MNSRVGTAAQAPVCTLFSICSYPRQGDEPRGKQCRPSTSAGAGEHFEAASLKQSQWSLRWPRSVILSRTRCRLCFSLLSVVCILSKTMQSLTSARPFRYFGTASIKASRNAVTVTWLIHHLAGGSFAAPCFPLLVCCFTLFSV